MILKFQILLKNHRNTITTIINYLFILYAFALPMAFDTEKIIFKIILVLFLLSGDLKEKLLFTLKNSVFQSMLLFLAMYILWTIGSEHKETAWWKIKIFASYFLLFPVFITTIRENFKEKILSAFLFAIFCSEVLSYTMMLHIHLPFIHFIGYGANVPFFYTYSQYVLLLSLSLGFVLYRLFSYTFSNLFEKTLYILFFLISTINIFMLASKLGYFLYLLSIGTTLLFIAKSHLQKKHLLFLFITVITTYFLAYNYAPTFHNRIHTIVKDIQNVYLYDNYNGSTGKRIAWNIYGLKTLKENNILFGVGTSDHIALVMKKLQTELPQQCKKNNLTEFNNAQLPGMATLHNEYLDHLVQFGIIGLFIVLNLFYQIYKAPSSSDTMRILRYILLVNILFYSFVNYFFILSQLGKIFFFLIALTLPGYLSNKNNK